MMDVNKIKLIVSYMRFIRDVYNELTKNADTSGEIPILPRPLQPTNPQQYFLVELSNGGINVTLGIDISYANVLGIQIGDEAYFFYEVSSDIYETVFPDNRAVQLPFNINYESLENAARVVDRREIPLGIGELDCQINEMDIGYNSPYRNKKIARALLVMIQMIFEAVRFRNIEQRVIESILGVSQYDKFYPDGLMIEYENNWGNLSARVQSAVHGIISPAFQLNIDGQVQTILTIDNVRQVVFFLAIMPLICVPNRVVPENSINDGFASSLMSVVSPISRSRLTLQQKEIRGYDKYHGYDKCDQDLEPKVHITGFDGLCVSVENGYYNDGNGVVLSVCRNRQEHQLWSLRSSDQTIHSEGKCLTINYEYSQENNVMIYDCNATVPRATKWQIQSSIGKIKTQKSGLSLTAEKDAAGVYNVVVDPYQHVPRQVWFPTNNTEPPVTKIVGYDLLCLTLDGVHHVQMANCDDNIKDKRWAVYPDGTIRPEQHQGRCLQYKHGQNEIIQGACSGYSDERWIFRADGTILHEATDMVMDVIETPALYQVTVNDYNGNRFSQIWFMTQTLC
uniref:Ribosome-inactivating protein n=2 Tax=Chenopodium quinoa TaxID=63459 RepID=A0A803N7E5_CHEQI